MVLGAFTNRQLQKCAEREAVMRRNVYAKHGLNSLKRMAEIEMMEAIGAHFKRLADLEEFGRNEPDRRREE
jgi:hypothetical protein